MACKSNNFSINSFDVVFLIYGSFYVFTGQRFFKASTILKKQFNKRKIRKIKKKSLTLTAIQCWLASSCNNMLPFELMIISTDFRAKLIIHVFLADTSPSHVSSGDE
jgi:hypothetical protein